MTRLLGSQALSVRVPDPDRPHQGYKMPPAVLRSSLLSFLILPSVAFQLESSTRLCLFVYPQHSYQPP